MYSGMECFSGFVYMYIKIIDTIWNVKRTKESKDILKIFWETSHSPKLHLASLVKVSKAK